ncbi:CoA-binding protein [Roseovarius faecimaris]|uniref:CoA-binding protein n=1 Tax=Roseovarius faecimaris TaxID=2494550 RepID=A0A6I6ILW9_9RHOB|nr:acetate--CoA ligase family protein [Roseovarius faecimaris]QGX97565.1 CoA-binding protein [Roseovarius faecimaris]
MTPAKRANFQRLLTPRHIAFVGGTDAGIAIGEARRAGFAGQMWAVNPRREHIAGVPCLPDLASLPEPPDAVFLAIRAAEVPAAVAELRERGAGGIVCYAAGFGEAHAEGAALEAQLKAELGDMVLIGPNCYGLINYVDRSALWPFAHGGGCPGYGAAILTQSGMFSSDITMARRSLPMAYMISAGNQADLGLAEFIDLLCDRKEVRAIGVHIEGLSDVAAFERAALKALEQGTPIVALKTGNSAIGESLTLSHTGSLAGSATLYQSLFERLGIISVTSPSQFLETLKFLCVAGAPAGNRLVGFTCSGGGATMLADHAETIALDFPKPGPEAHDALTALLPPIATLSNPLDYTTPIWGQPEKTKPVFAKAMEMIPGDATILVQDYPAEGLDESQIFYRNDAGAFAEAAAEAGLPAAICATIPENMDRETRELFISRGVAPMQGIHEALNAMRDAAWWAGRRKELLAQPPKALCVEHGAANAPTMLTEAEGKQRLAAAGFAVPEGRCVARDGLNAAADAVGYPCVLKMMSNRLAHKTEARAVALGLGSLQEVRDAADRMARDVGAYDAEAVSDMFLIEPMAPAPLAELVVAIRRDAQFGLSLTLGSGGILVELLGDTATLLLPASDAEIGRALDRLKVSRLLSGFRGKPAADRTGLIAALQSLAEFAMTRPDLAEIEINPLFVYEDRVLAIDALCQITPE